MENSLQKVRKEFTPKAIFYLIREFVGESREFFQFDVKHRLVNSGNFLPEDSALRSLRKIRQRSFWSQTKRRSIERSKRFKDHLPFSGIGIVPRARKSVNLLLRKASSIGHG